MEKEKLGSSVISAVMETYEIDLSRGISISEQQEPSEPTFAVCIKRDDYTVSLERHKIYRVLPDLEALEDHELRVIDESGEDYLFPRDWFMLVELPEALKRSLLQTRP